MNDTISFTTRDTAHVATPELVTRVVVPASEVDWNQNLTGEAMSDISTSNTAPHAGAGQFVTVVAVGSSRTELDENGTATVKNNLSLRVEEGAPQLPTNNGKDVASGDKQEHHEEAEQVVVFRLPGERLGLGLKFDGGAQAAQCVRRLFIQSIASNSPAARALVPWGSLEVGDQILHIEGKPVSSMTRVECVSLLKDAAMRITIGVLRGGGELPDLKETPLPAPRSFADSNGSKATNNATCPPCIVGEKRKKPLPPPLPPRGRNKKSPARPPKEPMEIHTPPKAFQDLNEVVAGDGSVDSPVQFIEDFEIPEEVTDTLCPSWDSKLDLPPPPAHYLDLLKQEDARGLCESESDETNSSASTVVDRLSISSSTTVSRNSSFNAHSEVVRFDLARALSPFEQLEKELDSSPPEGSRTMLPKNEGSPKLSDQHQSPTTDQSNKSVDSSPVALPAESPEAPPSPKAPPVKSAKTRSGILNLPFNIKSKPFPWSRSSSSSGTNTKSAGQSDVPVVPKKSKIFDRSGDHKTREYSWLEGMKPGRIRKNRSPEYQNSKEEETIPDAILSSPNNNNNTHMEMQEETVDFVNLMKDSEGKRNSQSCDDIVYAIQEEKGIDRTSVKKGQLIVRSISVGHRKLDKSLSEQCSQSDLSSRHSECNVVISDRDCDEDGNIINGDSDGKVTRGGVLNSNEEIHSECTEVKHQPIHEEGTEEGASSPQHLMSSLESSDIMHHDKVAGTNIPAWVSATQKGEVGSSYIEFIHEFTEDQIPEKNTQLEEMDVQKLDFSEESSTYHPVSSEDSLATARELKSSLDNNVGLGHVDIARSAQDTVELNVEEIEKLACAVKGNIQGDEKNIHEEAETLEDAQVTSMNEVLLGETDQGLSVQDKCGSHFRAQMNETDMNNSEGSSVGSEGVMLKEDVDGVTNEEHMNEGTQADVESVTMSNGIVCQDDKRDRNTDSFMLELLNGIAPDMQVEDIARKITLKHTERRGREDLESVVRNQLNLGEEVVIEVEEEEETEQVVECENNEEVQMVISALCSGGIAVMGSDSEVETVTAADGDKPDVGTRLQTQVEATASWMVQDNKASDSEEMKHVGKVSRNGEMGEDVQNLEKCENSIEVTKHIVQDMMIHSLVNQPEVTPKSSNAQEQNGLVTVANHCAADANVESMNCDVVGTEKIQEPRKGVSPVECEDDLTPPTVDEKEISTEDYYSCVDYEDDSDDGTSCDDDDIFGNDDTLSGSNENLNDTVDSIPKSEVNEFDQKDRTSVTPTRDDNGWNGIVTRPTELTLTHINKPKKIDEGVCFSNEYLETTGKPGQQTANRVANVSTKGKPTSIDELGSISYLASCTSSVLPMTQGTDMSVTSASAYFQETNGTQLTCTLQDTDSSLPRGTALDELESHGNGSEALCEEYQNKAAQTKECATSKTIVAQPNDKITLEEKSKESVLSTEMVHEEAAVPVVDDAVGLGKRGVEFSSQKPVQIVKSTNDTISETVPSEVMTHSILYPEKTDEAVLSGGIGKIQESPAKMLLKTKSSELDSSTETNTQVKLSVHPRSSVRPSSDTISSPLKTSVKVSCKETLPSERVANDTHSCVLKSADNADSVQVRELETCSKEDLSHVGSTSKTDISLSQGSEITEPMRNPKAVTLDSVRDVSSSRNVSEKMVSSSVTAKGLAASPDLSQCSTIDSQETSSSDLPQFEETQQSLSQTSEREHIDYPDDGLHKEERTSKLEEETKPKPSDLEIGTQEVRSEEVVLAREVCAPAADSPSHSHHPLPLPQQGYHYHPLRHHPSVPQGRGGKLKEDAKDYQGLVTTEVNRSDSTIQESLPEERLGSPPGALAPPEYMTEREGASGTFYAENEAREEEEEKEEERGLFRDLSRPSLLPEGTSEDAGAIGPPRVLEDQPASTASTTTSSSSSPPILFSGRPSVLADDSSPSPDGSSPSSDDSPPPLPARGPPTRSAHGTPTSDPQNSSSTPVPESFPTPGIPSEADSPSVLDRPPVSGSPYTPDSRSVPDRTPVPEFPPLPDVPPMTDITSAPDSRPEPDRSFVPDSPLTPDSPSLPETPPVASIPNTPGSPDTPPALPTRGPPTYVSPPPPDSSFVTESTSPWPIPKNLPIADHPPTPESSPISSSSPVPLPDIPSDSDSPPALPAQGPPVFRAEDLSWQEAILTPDIPPALPTRGPPTQTTDSLPPPGKSPETPALSGFGRPEPCKHGADPTSRQQQQQQQQQPSPPSAPSPECPPLSRRPPDLLPLGVRPPDAKKSAPVPPPRPPKREPSAAARPVVAPPEESRKSQDQREDVQRASAVVLTEEGDHKNDTGSDPRRGKMAVYEQRYSSCNQVGPTSFQRLPPDGHEFPNTFTESLPDKLSRYNRYAKLDLNTSSHSGYSELSSQFSRSAPGTPTSPPPALPKSASPSSKANSIASNSSFDRDDETLEQRHSSSSSSTTDEARPKDSGSYRTSSSSFSSRWRRQDEKSGKSVRDKIAMFSTEQPYPKSRKIEDIQTPDKNGCGSLKRAFTEDDVRVGNSSKISLARSQTLKSNGSSASSSCLSKYNTFSSMIDVSASESKENVRPVSAASSAADICQSSLRESYSKCEPVREEMETHRITKTADDSRVSGLHSRSQSMIDIGKPSLTKRHSIGAYDRPSVYKYGIEKPEDRERRTSLNNLIEQRRKSISKLRGLVIPESKCQTEKSSFDLPRISSIPPTAALKTMSLPRDTKSSSKHDSVPNTVCNESSADESSSSPALSTPPWKTQHGPYSLTKYSPSSKHKSVTEYQDQESAFTPNTLPSPQTSLRRNVSAYSDCSYSSASSSLDLSLEYGDNRSANDNVCNPSTYQSYMIEARLGKTEDSDNDSAVSSAQSYLSQDTSPSPSVSPTPEKLYRGSRTPTQNSKKGLLSRIPSEDSDGHRVLKPGSIEAENRRNVLKSAKCSSGRNTDDQSGPDIIPKVPLTPNEKHEEVPFTEKLDSDLRKNKAHVPRQASADSTSSSSSRRSSQDSSRRNSRESVIHVPKTQDEAIKVSAEPVYFDQHGDMYKEAQLKVAYMNEISDEFDELCSDKVDNVVNEIPITVARHIRDEDSYENNKSYGDIGVSWKRKDTGLGNILEKTNSHGSDSSTELLGDIPTSPTKSSRPRGFKALAESWQQRAEEDASPLPTAAPRERRTSRSTSVYEEGESFITKDKYSSISSRTTVTTYESVGDTESRRIKETFAEEESQTSRSASNLDLPRHEGHDRKLSMPEYSSSGIKMRERHDGSIPSRPTSLIEGSKNLSALEGENHYLPPKPLSPTASSADSREDFLDSTDSGSLSRTASKEVLEAFSRARVSVVGNSRTGAVFTPKVSDIMRAFERHDFGNRRSGVGTGTSHPRMSSLDSTASEDGSALYGSVSSLTSGQRDQYGSITSLASSTSLISPQELAQLIDEANQSLEESGTPSHEILVVVLHREIVCQGSIGITLAGGADYETKEITVHKIIPGSLADRDGRIQRGDRILSINGKNLRGVTHKEALTILKSPRPEVVLVLSRSRSVTPQESGLSDGDAVLSHRTAFINHVTTPRPPKILESPMDSKSLVSDAAALAVPRGPPMVTTLVKDGAGLGFSLEGGKDSPLGDRPLTIKKIFSGGTADKSGVLRVGDELVSVNGVDVTAMARIEAWNFLKKLPDGTVTLIIRKLEEQSKTE